LKSCRSDCTHLCCDWCGRWGVRSRERGLRGQEVCGTVLSDFVHIVILKKKGI